MDGSIIPPWGGAEAALPGSAANTRGRWTPARCGWPPAGPGRPGGCGGANGRVSTVLRARVCLTCYSLVSKATVQTGQVEGGVAEASAVALVAVALAFVSG